ncbi:hypothetical protein BU24DRAFT_22136 [Aaosphaeria arxii CBS 175.79]|uniref:Ribonuclease H2 subunit B n=1 Tax=Aaosphaeria arxii CBS 175.79 TaxID=1450172 RepID=A0A6A5Y7I1_9PLEO|nr:uncharacterized protein BU24DRAFT_22136 [Aaosphaeria arxii CBS 175.79]KAF2021525.1 hypothetical protein BU24DRAFT_22136 [Aaosphaeria arxii CBS 175.79]
MARTTRSKRAVKDSSPEPAPAKNIRKLSASVDNPHKLFVLPRHATKDSRIITLENPATAEPSRYFFCPEKGFYEFTCIAAPKKAPRSWLIISEKSTETESQEHGTAIDEAELGSGYVTKEANLFLATPIDALFLILPALAPKSRKDEKALFLSLDDHLDALSATSRHLKALLSQFPCLRTMLEKRFSACCDTVDAGDELMYRLSNQKLYNLLVEKAERMSKNGFPASMEERFMKPALDVPIMNIKREESTLSSTASVSEQTSTSDSQTSSASDTSTPTSQSTIATSISTATTSDDATHTQPLTTPAEIPSLLRLRSSITYLTAAYIPPLLQNSITQLLQTSTSPSFADLDAHLANIAKLRSEAAALRSMSDNISRKRGLDDDEEKVAEREEKKRKKEEEEKRKKTESRGIKQLKKVDTSGMMKLSSFFTKAPKK